MPEDDFNLEDRKLEDELPRAEYSPNIADHAAIRALTASREGHVLFSLYLKTQLQSLTYEERQQIFLKQVVTIGKALRTADEDSFPLHHEFQLIQRVFYPDVLRPSFDTSKDLSRIEMDRLRIKYINEEVYKGVHNSDAAGSVRTPMI